MRHEDLIRNLTCWSGSLQIEPVKGGITNANFRVTESTGRRYFVRTGHDIPVHGIMRFNELQASLAAAACGLSPELVYHEPGALVFNYINARTLTPQDIRQPDMLRRVLSLLQKCHGEMKKHLRGPTLMFWVYHVIRDYGHSLNAIESRSKKALPRLLAAAEKLEEATGRIDVTYCHNDLLSANFMDDGDRLWLVDWDYGGFNSPFFDLANLSSNNELSEEQERFLLASYTNSASDADSWRCYRALKTASLLRETLWSMVSEHYSDLDFDYVAYTQDYLARFDKAYDDFQKMR